VILSYCTLASELEKSGMGHLSLDWYQRAYQVASKFFLENAILQELKKLIDLSSGGNNTNNNPHDSRNPNSAQLSYREGTVTSSNERGIAEDNNNNNNTATEKEKVSARGARPRSALPRLSKVKMNNNDDNQNASYNNDEGNNTEQKKNHQPFATNNTNSNNNPASYLPDKNGPESPDRNDYDLPRPKSAVSKLGGGYQQNLGGSASYPNSRNNSPSHRHHPAEQQQQQFFPPEEDEEEDHHHYGQRSQQQQQQRPVSRQQPPQLRLPQQQQQQQYYNSSSRQQQLQSQPHGGDRHNSSTNNRLYDRFNLFLHPEQQQQQQANSGRPNNNKISPTNYAQTTTVSPLPFPHYRSVPSEPILPTYDPYEHHQQQGGRGQQQQQQPQLNTLQVSHSSPLLINPSLHSIVLLPSGSITSLNNPERKRPKSSSGQQRVEPRKTLASELLARKKQEFANSVENSQSKNSTLSLPSGMKRPSSSNSPNRDNRNKEEPETDDHHYHHQHEDNNHRIKTSKSNKTLISKVLHETTHSRKPTSPGRGGGGGSRPSSAVVDREKQKEKETSNHPSSNKETVPSSSSNNMAMSYHHTPQNPLLAIDEFGKEKIRKVAEFCFPYFKGLRIEAKYQIHRIGDRGYWYPGRIIKADFIQGLYDVEFENGDREKNISVENIRIPEYASKLLMLQSTTKNVLASSSGKSNNNKDENQGENNKEEEGGSGGDSGHRIPARVLRKQFDDDMHSTALKLLAGINQRSDQRKMERIQLKNTLVTRIQSLLRGVLLRLRFPKIRQQVEREKELRRKENELIEMEKQINESRNKACQTIEVQTGESLMMLDMKEPLEEGGPQDNNNNNMLRPQTTEDILFINNGNLLSPSSRNKPHPPPLVQQPFVTRPQPVQPVLPPTASPYVHHLPPPLTIYNNLPYNQQQHQQLLDQTLNVTNNNDSFPETPYGMDGINTLMGLDDIQERSVHHGKFINDSSPTHLDETAIFRGSESDIILIPRTNEEEMMMLTGGEGGDSNIFLQQKFHEMANLNNTLYFIQEEQKDLKQLDMKRNQEMLMQFHSLHQLLLLQTEELKQLKKDENKRKVELELYIQTLLNQQQKNLQSFQAQHLQQIEQELEVIHHEQQQQFNQGSQPQQEKEKQPQPEPLLSKTSSHSNPENTNQVPAVLSTPTVVPSSEELSPEDLKPTSSTSPRHNPGNGKTRTIKVPESSITLEVSVENSLIKPDDQHLLEEYGQLGVEDFWNSISSADFPLPLKPMKEPFHPTQHQNHATIEDHHKKQLSNQQQSSTSGNGSLDMDAIDHSLLSQMNNIPSDNNSHVSGGKSYPRNLEQINETAVE
jgi:hypothetical protein